MGMTESGRAGDSVYLRAWDDYERYSLQLTAAATSRLGHAAFRARSPQALLRRVEAIERSCLDIEWREGELGHGPAYRFHDPDGHVIELSYETEWYEASAALRPALKNQAQRFPARGANVRRLDHFNCFASTSKPTANALNATSASVSRADRARHGRGGEQVGHRHQQSYNFIYTKKAHGVRGRFHHITYTLDSRDEILRAADVFLEAGVLIETSPHKHAVQQTFFLYVFEPGGHRVEVANADARLVLAPDWKPIRWSEAERRKGQAWGLKTIETFHTHGTPPLPSQEQLGAQSAGDLPEHGIGS